MNDEKKNNEPFKIPRPEFPKRAVITGGMPKNHFLSYFLF